MLYITKVKKECLSLLLAALALTVPAATNAPSESEKKAVDLLRQACSKFEAVLSSPDASDTGEGTSLHAAALQSRAVIEARLYVAFLAVTVETAKRHRDNAQSVFEHLKKAHGDARLPGGERVVDATRAAFDEIWRASGR